MAAAAGGSVESFGLPCRSQCGEVAPGVLVHLYGLKKRLEVSCPKALEKEQTYTQMANYPEICRLLCHLLWLWGCSLRHSSGVLLFDVRAQTADKYSHRVQTSTRPWQGVELTGSSQINHVNIFTDNQKIKWWWLLRELLCCGSDSVSHFHALYPHL